MSISHITCRLVQSSTLSINPSVIPSKDVLHSLFLSLSPPISPSNIRDGIKYLQELEDENTSVGCAPRVDGEQQVLNDAILGRLVAGIYAEALDTLLTEAITTEMEAEWWADMERSWLSVAHHFIQTLPLRISSLVKDVLRVLRSNNQPISFSVFKPSSISDLLKKDTGLPYSIAACIFPHLQTHPQASLLPPPLAPFRAYSSSLRSSSLTPSGIITSVIPELWRTFSVTARHFLHYATLPLRLTSQEIHAKRLELERIRDERAEALGELTSKRDELSRTLQTDLDERAAFLQVINQVLAGRHIDSVQLEPPMSLLDALAITSSKVLPMHVSLHLECLRVHSLLRPSRFVRIWPSLLVLPPLTLYAVQRVSESQHTLLSLAKDAWDTFKGFCRGWLVEPLGDIAKTVRAGGEGSIIVQKGSIDADLKSLERMALSLAREKLSYNSTQLDELSSKLRLGDLTPILEIYEEDIKSPVRSAVSGTLLRSAFVQVQKAKVDVDQALAGIDKLLRSQELTFAFVGVAPALSLVYVAGGYLSRLYAGALSHGRLGGRRRRMAAWSAMRRIEHLLITQPRTQHEQEHRTQVKERLDSREGKGGALPHLAAGLLLLSVSSLRQYGETWLPPRSRLREGFLGDVGDLEDPGLGREEKILVVERMWRSWGQTLGWQRLMAEVSS